MFAFDEHQITNRCCSSVDLEFFSRTVIFLEISWHSYVAGRRCKISHGVFKFTAIAWIMTSQVAVISRTRISCHYAAKQSIFNPNWVNWQGKSWWTTSLKKQSWKENRKKRMSWSSGYIMVNHDSNRFTFRFWTYTNTSGRFAFTMTVIKSQTIVIIIQVSFDTRCTMLI